MIDTRRILCWTPLLCLACLAGCGSTLWESSLEAGLSKAANERRPALVMFSSLSSLDCIEMSRDVLDDPDVQNVLKSFVPVRLELLLNGGLAKELGVETVPAFVIYRPDRSVAAMQQGKMDARRFTVFLIKYRYY